MKDHNKKQKISFLDRILPVLYGTTAGRLLLRPLVSPWFSELGGKLLDTRLSSVVIPSFVRSNSIDLSQCETFLHTTRFLPESFVRRQDLLIRIHRLGSVRVMQGSLSGLYRGTVDFQLSILPIRWKNF